jgi:hypothetical protein
MFNNQFSMFNSQGENTQLNFSLHPRVQRLIAHWLTLLFALGKE